jgi:hypothetical protein
MMNCKDIENILSLYEDDLLSDAEKQAVEQHLKSCSKCAKAFAQLQKTGSLVDGLAEVEPPPWFKQKIMSRVREEAAKKSLAQKWLYPLRIRIPIQIMATIVVAVFAVYIYRSVNNQTKVGMPMTSPTVMETKKDMLSEQTTKLSETDKTVIKEKVYVLKDAQKGKIVMHDLPAGSNVVKTRELKKSMPPENESAQTMDMAKTMNGGAAVDRKDAYFAASPEKQTEQAKVVTPSSVAMERKKERYVLDDSMKQSEAPAKRIIMPRAVHSLHVANTDDAVGRVEKILEKYEAKNIVKQTPNGKIFFTAEIKAHRMKDFVAQLKTIGRVEGKDMPVVDGIEGDIPVLIEILSH